jgi:hypothetical protein
VLTRHQQRNHHVRNFFIGNRGAVLVDARHQVPDHILGVLLATSLATLTDNIHVGLSQLLLRSITLAVVRKRCPGQHEVDGSEALVEIVVHFREGGVESIPNLLTLERARSSVDGDFSNVLGDVEGTLGFMECGSGLDELIHLVGNQGNVRSKRFGGEAEFDELWPIDQHLMPRPAFNTGHIPFSAP